MTSHLRDEEDPKENAFYAKQDKRLQRIRQDGGTGNANEGQKGKWVHHNGKVPYQVDR